MNISEGLKSGVITSLLAFLIQGSWAIYSNIEYGVWLGIKAGLVQGTCSLLMTFSVTQFMQFLINSIHGINSTMKFSVVFIAACCGMTLVQATAHWIANTPEILITIFPAISVGTIYCFLYSAKRIYT
ncbi:hypothetical protein KDD30_10485 [Photobacterium sp. GJ3]|uniref:hypothetical protein n=1 Tax=Photobacterium sp. GJ3 TaxID=2829502 RepID=UPI001B8BB782|nr:hypothetical protein [Photobacterium sp. GJ3]QUJ66588.1 hypothetical protein KDD30_10485 [Photobacterium sp. GJ3]